MGIRTFPTLARWGIAATVVLGILGAAPAPPGDTAPLFRCELRDGTYIEGELQTSQFPIRLAHGLLTVDSSQIRKIDFRPHDAPDQKDRIELIDREVRRGILTISTLQIANAKEIRRLPFAEIREMRSLQQPHGTGIGSILIGLVTLAAMEIVLGIDNIIFLAIVAGRLPEAQQPKARRLGLIAALGTRLLLLGSLSFIMGLTEPLFTLPALPFLNDGGARDISWRDLILLAGGLFLIGKSVKEIHGNMAREPARGGSAVPPPKRVRFGLVLMEIAVLDIVFSLDSVITAIGMVEELWVMVAAMVVAMFVMMAFAGTVAAFIGRNPTLKVLALSFLILIGVLLVAESLGQHIEKGYIYFAMVFALGVEGVNLRMAGREGNPARSARGSSTQSPPFGAYTPNGDKRDKEPRTK